MGRTGASQTGELENQSPLTKSSWPDHRVNGYYGIDDSVFMEPSAVPCDLLTDVCFTFGSISTDYSINITGGQSLISTVFSTAIANGIKPILSVGRWGYGSSMYSEMVSTNASRAALISLLRRARSREMKCGDSSRYRNLPVVNGRYVPRTYAC